MVNEIIFIKTLKNNARRGKAQRLAPGSGVPVAGAAGAVAQRCPVKGSRAGLGTAGHARGRGTSSTVSQWQPGSSGSRVPQSRCCPWPWPACRRAAFHMCSRGLPIGVLRWRGWSLKSAPVPVTDDIFMQENKTRISDGLCYLCRQLGATDARQEVLCLNFKTVSGI